MALPSKEFIRQTKEAHYRAMAEKPAAAARKAHHVMTPEEYAVMKIQGWHEVCKDIDNAGNVGVRFLSR